MRYQFNAKISTFAAKEHSVLPNKDVDVETFS